MGAKNLMKLKISKDLVKKLTKKKENPKLGSILLLDDEAENLFALKHLLEENFVIHTFTDPKEALNAGIIDKVDVIISDQRMPEMLGTEFLTAVKKRSDDNIRVILTGYTDINDLIDCINEGLIYRYLVKPWEPNEILSVIHQAMGMITKERIVRQLIPEQIISRLYPSGLEKATIGHGKEIDCALMMLDIREFTKITGKMSPSDTFKMLSSYMESISPLVTAHHGFIDKYLGDGFLAVFDRTNTAFNDAICCATEIFQEHRSYNKKHRSKPIPEFRLNQEPRLPLRIGMGINCGRAMLGTIGFSERVEFTVLGDAVNITSRIEHLNRFFKTKLLVNSKIINEVEKNKLAYRYIGKVKIKGKLAPLGIYEIYEFDSPETKDLKEKFSQRFSDAILLRDENKHDESHMILGELLKDFPDDQVAQYYYNLSSTESSYLKTTDE